MAGRGLVRSVEGAQDRPVTPPVGSQLEVTGRMFALPEGCVGRKLSDPTQGDAVRAFLASSPDATLRHQPAWFAFARSINRRADLLLVERDGQPQFALPVHWAGRRTITTGYGGVLFPAGRSENLHKRAVRTLRAFLDANPTIGLQGIQSGQGPGYDDVDRANVIRCQLESERLAGPAPWCRMLVRDPALGAFDEQQDEASLFAGYETKLRSQIRQGRRNGLTVEVHVPSTEAEVRRVYGEYAPLHVESWARTGLRPHRPDFWVGLAMATIGDGGRDVVAFARSGGELVAAASCHVFGSRAIYNAGASRTSGRDARANPLSLHAGIMACYELGVTHFELGRFNAVEPNEKEVTVSRYKSQFGGRLFPLMSVATPRTRTQVAFEQAHRLQRKLRIRTGGTYLYV